MFVRPFQVFVLTPIIGARRPTHGEAALIEPIWADIADANGLPANRYVVRVVDTDEVNAFACGGHLVVVTTFAVSRTDSGATPRGARPRVEPPPRPAHGGDHVRSLAVGAGRAAGADRLLPRERGPGRRRQLRASGPRRSPRSAASAAAIFSGLAWVFTAAIRGSDAITNMVGHSSEYEADQLAVRMGFGAELAGALRYVLGHGLRRPTDRLAGAARPRRIRRHAPASPASKP